MFKLKESGNIVFIGKRKVGLFPKIKYKGVKEHMRLILFFGGLILLLIGLTHPLGFVQSTVVEYTLYIGIIVFAIGILMLPGKSEAKNIFED